MRSLVKSSLVAGDIVGGWSELGVIWGEEG